jgi:hypothetical protein
VITVDNTAKLEDACSSVRCGCALERLAAHFSLDDQTLDVVGERVGLSTYEVEGIMDGWDVGARVLHVGSHGLFHWAYYPVGDEVPNAWGVGHEPEYEAGRALGMALAHRFAPVQQ